MRPGTIRWVLRALGVLTAALLLVAVFAQTTLYPRVLWWFDDSVQQLLSPALPMEHVLAVDVDDDSIRRLEPELGAWPYSRDVYARVARFLAAHGARAIAFDILFSESRAGDDALAASLDRRSVLAAAALPEATGRPPEYVERLKQAALFDAASAARSAIPTQTWPDLTLPLAKLTQRSGARIGVITTRADADGIVRRASLLHQTHGQVLPSLVLAALLAAEPSARAEFSHGEFRLGERAWPLDPEGRAVFRYPSNAAAIPVIPFYQLLAAQAGAQGTAHVGELVRDKIVYVGSSAAVLGDFAYTPVGRLPGLSLNALFTELLLTGGVRRPGAWWLDALLLALTLAIPAAMAFRDTAARPSEFLWGPGAIGLIGAGGGIGLSAIGQSSSWLFAALTGLVAQALALGMWLFALYQERQRLFYEKFAAQEANRLKTEFLSHMTHELRTPITAIMGFNKINQFADDLGREQRVHNSEIVARNCEYLLALVNNNLDLARIEAGQLAIERKPENVSALLDDVVSTMSIMADEKNLALRLVKGARLPPGLSLDALRLRQILINLLGNAIKFTAAGEIALEVGWSAGRLQLAVRDTGVGIPEESLGRVFEPFERLAGSRTGGTGLGLTVTRRLVELMGGTVQVSSTPGEGTEFLVRIPAAEIEHAPPRHVRATPAVFSPLAGKVLVAEDVEHLRHLVELYLKKLGLECVAVSNGFEAVEAAMAAEFDILLLDMEMPVMDGFEAARVLRERGYGKPIVALTAHSDGVQIERARHEGCSEVLNKPVTLERLREALEPLLAGRVEFGAARQPPPRAEDRRR
ncbi:MAG: CHASE2 domain-containing protein [Burkholderiales bacterium]